MKTFVKLTDNWTIKEIESTQLLSEKEIEKYSQNSGNELSATMPSQVHEILLRHGKIEDPLVMGNTEKCLWVAETDWIYRCVFTAVDISKRNYLVFKGLDTLADVYLNGMHIASHGDMYIPLKVDVTDQLQDVNTLLLHFHSPHKYLNEQKDPAVDSGRVARHKLLRKSVHDFIDFLGTKPYLTNIGVFDDVILVTACESEILNTDIQANLNDDFSEGTINLYAEGMGGLVDGVLHITATSPDGRICGKLFAKPETMENKSWICNASLSIDRPALWWPRTHGDQPLYNIQIELIDNNTVLDSVSKNVGFRKIEMVEPFHFYINGTAVRLWGANLAPMKRITNCWDSEIAKTLLDMVENCHMNILRVWGEGVPYPDELYDEADRRGILLWQEFYTSYGMHPNSPEYRELCRKEAEYMVKRLKNHASILMWCGGNESTMGAEYDFPGEKCIGEEIYLEDFKKVCETLDPERYYHGNSPFGGAFANDPREGDTHGYTHIWFVPGSEFPVMLSENTRVSTPALKSLRRYLGDDRLWPDGYSGAVRNHNEPPMPEAWLERAPGGVWQRTKGIERFFDADTPEALVYRMGSAHALHLRRTVESLRRGRPSGASSEDRICRGHLVWKLNEPYPAFYSSMIDYYLEPYIPYYTLRRTYEPIMLSFDIGNDIYLWLINDSRDIVEGTVVCNLYDPRTNRILKEIKKNVCVTPDESKIIFRLDEFGQFKRENFLYARLENKDGNTIARVNDYVDDERYLFFPDAKVQLEYEDGVLVVTTDKFARCIELSGNDHGDEFGWFFEDNYFDLMPGEVKRIKVLGKHQEGTITAKAQYSSHSAMLTYKKLK